MRTASAIMLYLIVIVTGKMLLEACGYEEVPGPSTESISKSCTYNIWPKFCTANIDMNAMVANASRWYGPWKVGPDLKESIPSDCIVRGPWPGETSDVSVSMKEYLDLSFPSTNIIDYAPHGGNLLVGSSQANPPEISAR